MQLEPAQAADVLGPLAAEEALSDVRVFGSDRDDIGALIQKALKARRQDPEVMVDALACKAALPASFAKATTIADKLRALRAYAREHLHQNGIVFRDLKLEKYVHVRDGD